jgi:hypothetical protein
MGATAMVTVACTPALLSALCSTVGEDSPWSATSCDDDVAAGFSVTITRSCAVTTGVDALAPVAPAAVAMRDRLPGA